MEARQAEAISADVVEQMQAGVAYILGPDTTIRAIAQALTVEKTLVDRKAEAIPFKVLVINASYMGG